MTKEEQLQRQRASVPQNGPAAESGFGSRIPGRLAEFAVFGILGWFLFFHTDLPVMLKMVALFLGAKIGGKVVMMLFRQPESWSK